MMSCGTSSRYGSSLLLKTADFSIQGVFSKPVFQCSGFRTDGSLSERRGSRFTMAYFAVFSNVRSMALPRATAASSASLAVF